MYKNIFPLLVILFSTNSFAQTPASDTSLDTKTTLTKTANAAAIVLGKAQQPPAFPGGKAGWADYLKKNINRSIPLINKATPGNYNVIVRFTVDKEGTIKNVAAETNCGYGMEAELMRCIKASPQWKPAQTTNKEVVNFTTRQLVIFKIKDLDIEIELH